jgi:hypothetical protein
MLWAKGGPIGWSAFLVNTAAVASTGDIPLALLTLLPNNSLVSTAGIFGQILTVVLMRPAPLALLITGIFYLWVYVWHSSGWSETGLEGSKETANSQRSD